MRIIPNDKITVEMTDKNIMMIYSVMEYVEGLMISYDKDGCHTCEFLEDIEYAVFSDTIEGLRGIV